MRSFDRVEELLQEVQEQQEQLFALAIQMHEQLHRLSGRVESAREPPCAV